MKIIIIVCLAITILFGSCRERPINGHLDGYWQMTSMTVDSTGVDTSVADQRFVSIARHTIQLNGAGVFAVGEFVYDRDAMTLTIRFPYGCGTMVTAFGMPNTPCTAECRILKVDRSQLILNCPAAGRTVTYRRF